MYLGKPKHLVKSRGVFTAEERKAIQEYILLYRSKMRSTAWEDKAPYTVEDQYSNGCSYGDGGHFSVVIDHPSDEDKIIKIQIKPSDVYPVFANLVVSGYIQNYVVQFFSTGQIMGHNVYIMERVEVLAEARHMDDTVEEIWDNLNWLRAYSLASLVAYAKHEPSNASTTNRALIYLRKRIDTALRGLEDWCYDLHSYNWGIRKDGTLVCLDPIA